MRGQISTDWNVGNCAHHKFNLLHLYWRWSQAYNKSCDEDDSLVGLSRARPRRLAGHRRVDALRARDGCPLAPLDGWRATPQTADAGRRRRQFRAPQQSRRTSSRRGGAWAVGRPMKPGQAETFVPIFVGRIRGHIRRSVAGRLGALDASSLTSKTHASAALSHASLPDSPQQRSRARRGCAPPRRAGKL